MNDDNGGQAFPTMSNTEYIPGMTLRDWFAGQALAGMASLFIQASGSSSDIAIANAKVAYSMADAMLDERAKE